MTPQEINIAIAEECGWIFENRSITYDGQLMPYVIWFHGGKEYNECPNYHGDLNAMQEAENTLSMDETYQYGEKARHAAGCVGKRGGHYVSNGFGCYAIATLTAAQRAEAFLKVKGKWKE